jgi:leucine-zipper of insertion element IS481
MVVGVTGPARRSPGSSSPTSPGWSSPTPRTCGRSLMPGSSRTASTPAPWPACCTRACSRRRGATAATLMAVSATSRASIPRAGCRLPGLDPKVASRRGARLERGPPPGPAVPSTNGPRPKGPSRSPRPRWAARSPASAGSCSPRRRTKPSRGHRLCGRRSSAPPLSKRHGGKAVSASAKERQAERELVWRVRSSYRRLAADRRPPVRKGAGATTGRASSGPCGSAARFSPSDFHPLRVPRPEGRGDHRQAGARGARGLAGKWVRRFRAEGEAGLLGRSSAPRRVHSATPPERVAGNTAHLAGTVNNDWFEGATSAQKTAGIAERFTPDAVSSAFRIVGARGPTYRQRRNEQRQTLTFDRPISGPEAGQRWRSSTCGALLPRRVSEAAPPSRNARRRPSQGSRPRTFASSWTHRDVET